MFSGPKPLFSWEKLVFHSKTKFFLAGSVCFICCLCTLRASAPIRFRVSRQLGFDSACNQDLIRISFGVSTKPILQV